jgi:hypothetical protein
MRFGGLIIDTVVCLTLAKWETVSGQFGGYFNSNDFPPNGTQIVTSLLQPERRFCDQNYFSNAQLRRNMTAVFSIQQLAWGGK